VIPASGRLIFGVAPLDLLQGDSPVLGLFRVVVRVHNGHTHREFDRDRAE
jgi:hypothetical protein